MEETVRRLTGKVRRPEWHRPSGRNSAVEDEAER